MRAEDQSRQAAESARYRLGASPGPVDVLAAIGDLGIRLLRYPFPDADALEGAYLKSRGAAYIFVNSARHHRRQRFTAAHELGHHFLGVAQDFAHYDEEPVGFRPHDRPADWFAAHFLMDEASVREFLSGETDPLRMAILTLQQYDISLPAVGIHLWDLQLIDRDAKDEILRLAADPSITNRQLGAQVGVRLGSEPGPDSTFDPSPDYFRSLIEIRDSGFLSDERFAQMAKLRG